MGRHLRLAEVDRLAGRRRAAHGQPLVERHGPAGWQVVNRQPRRVQIHVLLHRLAQLHHVAPVLGRDCVAGQQVALHRARRRIGIRRHQIAEGSAAEDVADEGELRAVPDEEHRATGQLALGLRDHVPFAGGKFQLRLAHAIGPFQCHEVRLRPAAEARAQRLQALARAGVRIQRIQQRPAPRNPHLDQRADAGGVGAHLLRLAAARGLQGQKAMAASARRPPRHAVGCCSDNGRACAGVVRQRDCAGHACRQLFEPYRAALWIDDAEAARVYAQQLKAAVAIEVRDIERETSTGRGVSERRLGPVRAFPLPPQQSAIRREAVEFAPPVGIGVRGGNRHQRHTLQRVEACERLIAPSAVVAPDAVRRRLA